MFKLFMILQVFVFRLTHGKGMASMRGMPILLLNSIGRKTGKHRTTPLMYLRDGDNYVIIASNNGRDKHPSWFYNIKNSDNVEIEIPGKRIEASPSVATETEKEQLWSQLIAKAPFYDGYRKGTTRAIPMVVLRPC
jgi:deazaflavin-dependent oxidoreductase (nitroreductase family)